MGPHSWRVTGYSCPVGAAWEPLEAPAPGIRGGCWPAGCRTNPACSELSFDWAPKPRPGCRARGGLKTTQLKHRKHLGLNWEESGSSFKNPRRITKPLSKTKPKSLTTDHFVKKKKKAENLSDTSLGASTKHLPPAQARCLDTPSPPQRPGMEPRSPPAHPSPACWCQSVPLSRCPVPGARRGGKAGRSRGSSLNSMASVHYYTVRIFIWTAKLKTDFCQNCRSHKNDDTGWGLFL